VERNLSQIVSPQPLKRKRRNNIRRTGRRKDIRGQRRR
jgi:hypothetical protein